MASSGLVLVAQPAKCRRASKSMSAMVKASPATNSRVASSLFRTVNANRSCALPRSAKAGICSKSSAPGSARPANAGLVFRKMSPVGRKTSLKRRWFQSRTTARSSAVEPSKGRAGLRASRYWVIANTELSTLPESSKREGTVPVGIIAL